MGDIAVIGLVGKFPETQDVDEFNERLADSIWVSKAGTLSGVEDFDIEFWNLSKEEMFLKRALHALNDGGIDTSAGDQDESGMSVRAANHSITKPI